MTGAARLEGRRLPKPPDLPAGEERRRRKLCVAATLRVFAGLGFDEGVGGHVTARDPELLDHFWVNPFGRHFGLVRPGDLLLVAADGTVVEGDGPLNEAAFAIHSAVHRARPDVVAAAHAHSANGRAWSTLGRLLDPITQDACSFYGDHVVFDDFTGVVLDRAEGDRIAAALGPHKAAILRNHGLLTVGRSVDEAAYWFVSMDRSCGVQLAAEGAGRPMVLGHDVAAATARQVGRSRMGWFGFQPLLESVLHSAPDLID